MRSHGGRSTAFSGLTGRKRGAVEGACGGLPRRRRRRLERLGGGALASGRDGPVVPCIEDANVSEAPGPLAGQEPPPSLGGLSAWPWALGGPDWARCTKSAEWADQTAGLPFGCGLRLWGGVATVPARLSGLVNRLVASPCRRRLHVSRAGPP